MVEAFCIGKFVILISTLMITESVVLRHFMCVCVDIYIKHCSSVPVTVPKCLTYHVQVPASQNLFPNGK